MPDSVIVISAAAVLAGLAVSLAIRKPSVFVLGLGVAALLAIVTRDEKMQGLGNAFQKGVDEITAPASAASVLGATSNRTEVDMGPARMHDRAETAAVDPTLYPVPFRVRRSEFREDPDDDRIRWNTTGPEGSYVGWRRGFML